MFYQRDGLSYGLSGNKLDKIHVMKRNGMKKKGYFSLKVITVCSTVHKLSKSDTFSRYNPIAYKAQERKTSPPEEILVYGFSSYTSSDV